MDLFDWFDKHFAKLWIVGLIIGLVFMGLIGWGIVELISWLKRN